jgi:hypothetical protein
MDAGSRGTTLAARERLESPQKPTQDDSGRLATQSSQGEVKLAAL